MKDDEGTWVLTKRKYYIFTWDFGKYKNTIARSESCLTELDIQAGFKKFAGFSRGWDKFKYIPHLALTLPPYAQRRIQEQSSQWILLQNLRMKL